MRLSNFVPNASNHVTVALLCCSHGVDFCQACRTTLIKKPILHFKLFSLLYYFIIINLLLSQLFVYLRPFFIRNVLFDGLIGYVLKLLIA
jgi:hypothetical protein